MSSLKEKGKGGCKGEGAQVLMVRTEGQGDEDLARPELCMPAETSDCLVH